MVYHSYPRNYKQYFNDNFKNKFYRNIPVKNSLSENPDVIKANHDLIIRNHKIYKEKIPEQ
jgi:hypothetical protein